MNSIELFPFMVKIFSSLAIVIGVMIVCIYLLRKIMKKADGTSDGRELIRILSTKSVGSKSSIMLVEVLDKILVIGLSSNNMLLLTSIEDQLSLERTKQVQGWTQKRHHFSEHLALYKARLFSLCRPVEKSGGENA